MHRSMLILLLFILLLRGALMVSAETPDLTLPDFDALWNYEKPAETEKKFRKLLPQAKSSGNKAYLAELLTQIARTEGLQGKFTEGHHTLDEVAALLQPGMKRQKVRYLLERGRIFNSGGDAAKARPLFLEAWELAGSCGEDGLAVDAAHMMGIVTTGEEALDWNRKALALAESSTQETARKWKASLYNNIGWIYHDRRDYQDALEMFGKALALRQEKNQPSEIRVAKWCVARCLRSLGRTGEALAMQKTIKAELEAIGESDKYVDEEIAECLKALAQEGELSQSVKEGTESIQSPGKEQSQKKQYVFTDERHLPRDYTLPTTIIPVNPEIFTADSKEWESAGEGMKRKIFFNDRLTMVLLEIDRPVKPGEEVRCHYHAHDQITYVLEGKIKVKVGEETREIGPGGCYVVPSNVHHGIVTLTRRVIILDLFTPPRDDFRN